MVGLFIVSAQCKTPLVPSNPRGLISIKPFTLINVYPLRPSVSSAVKISSALGLKSSRKHLRSRLHVGSHKKDSSACRNIDLIHAP